jgi:hypothetical protein
MFERELQDRHGAGEISHQLILVELEPADIFDRVKADGCRRHKGRGARVV